MQKLHSDLNTLLTCFSPISKDKRLLMPQDDTEIDVLIATDCISEGQNLQDCDYLINYDIHWNPVRHYSKIRANRSYQEPPGFARISKA